MWRHALLIRSNGKHVGCFGLSPKSLIPVSRCLDQGGQKWGGRGWWWSGVPAAQGQGTTSQVWLIHPDFHPKPQQEQLIWFYLTTPSSCPRSFSTLQDIALQGSLKFPAAHAKSGIIKKSPASLGLFRLSACLPSRAFRSLWPEPAPTTDCTLTYLQFLEPKYP